jgi:hypothetical protein
MRDPASAPLVRNTAAGPLRRPHVIYFDERSSHGNLRRDPRFEQSYRYDDEFIEVAKTEREASGRIFHLMDNGFSENDKTLSNKWFAYCKILSLIQEAPMISLFHQAGFDIQPDEDGNPVEVARQNPVTSSAPEIPHELD